MGVADSRDAPDPMDTTPALTFTGTLLLVAFASQAAAQSVTDGDTLNLHGTRYRLFGIDAPELKQWCGDYPAGAIAAVQLEHLLKGANEVVCERKDTDRYGRTVAVCRADGRDIGRQMVRLGFAYAFTRYSRVYAGEEEEARQENTGVHAHKCQSPWEWRTAHRK